MSVDLSVSIVSYNTKDLLRQCLTTLAERQAAGEVTMEITVADNGSQDGSPEMVEAEFASVRVLRTGGNLGFGRANNLALDGAGGKYFCLLNSDAEPEPGALGLLRDFLDTHASVGLAGGQLVWPDGRPQPSWANDPRLSGVFWEQTFLDKLRMHLQPAASRLPDAQGPRDVAQVSGACLLLRPEAWRMVEGFDPAYFMYQEDFDLNVRLRRAGWGISFVPQARIRHHLGASSAGDWQTRARMVTSYNASRIYYFARFLGPTAAEWVRRFCLLGASLRLLGWTAVSLVRPAARDKARLFRRVLGRTRYATAQGEGYVAVEREPQLVPLPQAEETAEQTSPSGLTISDGKRLRNPFLAGALADEELGVWALDAQTINYLEQWIIRHRPQCVLEFGSGLSTVCLARFFTELYGAEQRLRVFSIEQNEWQANKTRAHLSKQGLSDCAAVLHAPLQSQIIEGEQAECYSLPLNDLHAFLGDAKPDMVLIDGPAGDDIVRFGTLPLVHDALSPSASFFLDDAWRPEEQRVARLWAQLPYLSVQGILQVGKGLLHGLANPEHANSENLP